MDDPNIDWTAVVAENKIREGFDAGEFDNLRGAGQPLDASLLATPVYERFAARLMKESGALPEWLQLKRDIDREMRELLPARERSLAALRRTGNAVTRERMAHRLRTVQRERLELVNAMVLKYNFGAPMSAPRAYRTFKIRDEMATLEAEISAAARASDVPTGRSTR